METRKKPSWVWTVFFLMYIFVVSGQTTSFLDEQSDIRVYYRILTGFTSYFLIPYLLTILSLILDLLAVVPFFNFIDPKRHSIGTGFISPLGWKWLFVVRFALIFSGHQYEYKKVKAIMQDDIWVALSMINLYVIFYIPSHLSNFIYAYYLENHTESCKTRPKNYRD